MAELALRPLPLLGAVPALEAAASAGRGVPPSYNGIRSVFSRRYDVTDALGKTYKVNRFIHPVSHKQFIQFPDEAIALRVRITPQGSRTNAPWRNSALDRAEANRKFGMRTDYDWRTEFGQPMTWHHDVERGVMQLVPTEIHKPLGADAHIGGVSLWYR